MAGQIRYCNSADGTRIAYSIEGDGPALVELNAVWESTLTAEIAWVGEAYAPLRRGRTVVHYCPRGTGVSQRRPPTFNHDAMVADLEAVIDAAGLHRFALFGSTFSVPWAIDFAVRHPQRVEQLVLARGAAHIASVMTTENLQSLVSLTRSNWDMALQLFSDLGTRRTSEVGLAFADHARRSVEPEDAARWLEDLHSSTDVRDLLPRVEAPTLILHRVDETMVPFTQAEELAAHIPHARLVALPGSGPISMGDDVATVMQIIIDFLDEGSVGEVKKRPEFTDGPFRTVLFTDLVGHTEMMQRLGDERGRAVLREHERITREVLRAHGGAEVKTMGDGFMASFGSVTRAVDCAIALQRAFAEHEGEPIQVRVGLNAGEPIEEDGDLFGATVILASRICAKAGAGEILIPEPLRHLLAGKSYAYADRGETALKGFDDAVRLYEVRWQT